MHTDFVLMPNKKSTNFAATRTAMQATTLDVVVFCKMKDMGLDTEKKNIELINRIA